MKKGGCTVSTAAPALFAFMGFASSSGGLSVSRWACVPPRYGSGYAQTSQRKSIIRTHPLSGKGSDYMGLVPVAGLEPARLAALDFESSTSTNSITPAGARESYHVLSKNARVNRPLFPKNFLVRPPNPSRIR